jgi:2-iminoacetate synthase ThiH
MKFSFDTNLNRIAKNVEGRERSTFSEGVELCKTNNVHALGKLADSVRRKINSV